MSVRRLAVTFERCAAASPVTAATRGMSVTAISSGAERSVPALAELFESGAASAILARRRPTPTVLLPVANKPREAATLAPAPKAMATGTFSLAFLSTASDISTAASSDEEDDENAEPTESSDSEPECDVEPVANVSPLGRHHEPELELERCTMEENGVNAALESLAAEDSNVPTALITAAGTDASCEPLAVKRTSTSAAASAILASGSSSSSAVATTSTSNSENDTSSVSNAALSDNRHRSARRSLAIANDNTTNWTPPMANARFMNYANSERYQAARQAGLARRQQLERQQQQRRAEELARARASAAQQAATARHRQSLAVRGAAARVFGYEQDARFVAQREANRARIVSIREARALAAAARFN